MANHFREPAKEEPKQDANEDLEDGEIEDDEDDVPIEPVAVEPAPAPPVVVAQPVPVAAAVAPKFVHPDKAVRFDRADRRGKYEDKKKAHLTEAEKSVMYLHKLERMEREKREKYRREQGADSLVVDDYASSIEKAIASVLKKDRTSGDEEKDEEKRGKKRKKKDKDKDRKKKQRKIDSPKQDEMEDSEILNVRGGSPDNKTCVPEQSQSPQSEAYDTNDSEYSSDSRDERKDRKRDYNKRGSKASRNRTGRDRKYNRDRSRDKRTEVQLKDSKSVCVFYVQGKCHKGDECPYSHEALPPMKLELCKFYLMDCCAKGEKCLYMHSEFPCKFYHTGLQCQDGDNCRFAHGKLLSEGLKQILFKHIETAPREILGTFPRMSRDEALNSINTAQKALEVKYGSDKKEPSDAPKSLIPSLFDINIPVPPELMQSNDDGKKDRNDKPSRNRPSRWQDAEPNEATKAGQFQPSVQLGGFDLKGFYSEHDQDMRVNSNGDIDMRTLPMLPLPNPLKVPDIIKDSSLEATVLQDTKDVDHRNSNFLQFDKKKDVDIRQSNDPSAKDVDARQLVLLGTKDVDIRNFSSIYDDRSLSLEDRDTAGDDSTLEIVTDDDNDKKVVEDKPDEIKMDLPASLPKKQRELFMRIQAQQKENLLENQKQVASDNEEDNVDWYSDDDDDNRLTIKDDTEDIKEKSDDNQDDESNRSNHLLSPPQIKPLEVMEKLGDLSKIDISAEVTKLLSTINQSGGVLGVAAAAVKEQKVSVPPRDPRQQSSAISDFIVRDPRRARVASIDSKPKTGADNKLSMYEQGGYPIDNKDVDLRNTEKDLDFRTQPMKEIRPGRSDVDLRQLNLPFKAMENYTPATEIDASMNSLIPLTWKLTLVDIPPPDYTGLKLNAQDAQTTGDPRLRKIFRLSTDEKDSPASPKQSPKATAPARVDPRRRKQQEEAKTDPTSMSYNQQLSMLQSSAFYQSLTSNQKLLLNQELSSRTDQSGPNDPILTGILSSLGLISGTSNLNPANGNALSILANVNNMNPSILNTITQNPAILGQNPNMLGQNQPNMLNQGQNLLGQSVNPNILAQNSNIMNQMAQSIVQPGLLGAAPGIPNLPPDFQINFDPRNGGLLGNAPPFQNFADGGNFNNFNSDEFYPDGNFGGSGNRNNDRSYNRDNRSRRGGRNNFNRNNPNRNFRNRNRSNRSHTPP